MARPKNQTARRTQLIDAASRRISIDGVDGFGIETLASDAGLSPNTVRYYYNDLDRLLVEVHRQAVHRFCDKRMRLVQAQPDPRHALAHNLIAGVPDNSDDHEWRLTIESAKVARNDDLYPMLNAWLYHQQVALYVPILTQGQDDGLWELTCDASTGARSIVALEDRLGALVMMEDPATPVTVARKLLFEYAQLVTGIDLVEFQD